MGGGLKRSSSGSHLNVGIVDQSRLPGVSQSMTLEKGAFKTATNFAETSQPGQLANQLRNMSLPNASSPLMPMQSERVSGNQMAQSM